MTRGPDIACWVLAVVAALAYGIGLYRLWRRAGVGHGVSRAQAWAFAAGWIASALPTLSGLHQLGLRTFTVHMIEHELLILVAAPLFVLARPLPVFAWALPEGARHSLRRWLAAARGPWQVATDLSFATLVHAAVLWSWHLPSTFRATLSSAPLHSLQHVSFMGSALLFWWAVLSPAARRHPAGPAIALFVTGLTSSLLGALLTFSTRLWYPPAVYVPFCGLTSIEDQQVAGLFMWIPAGFVYVGAALWLLAPMLRAAPVKRLAAA